VPSRVQTLVADRLPEPFLDAVRSARRRYWRARAPFSPAPAAPARPAVRSHAPVRALLGPANFAGQAWGWAKAAEEHLDGVDTTVMSVAGGLAFPTDYLVPLPAYRSPRWQREQEQWVTATFTHVLIDAMRSLFGSRYAANASGDLPVLRRAGISVGLIAHGSDIRVGSRHRELYEWSPWNDESWAHGRRLETQARRLGEAMNSYDGPRFVSTPDLLDFAPGAAWLPVVVEPGRWASTHPPLERARPIVLHVPTNPELKGSRYVDAQLQPLHDAGLIDYRRLRGIPPDEMPALVADADIVVDQLVLGLYSVMAVQAMAAGRVVVAHVADRVRARIGQELPIAEATPADLASVVESLVAERDASRALAARGTAYAHDVHDGRRSASVLAPFFDRPLHAAA
jgi:hypothetical protein